MITEQEALAKLRAIKYPGYSRDIVSFGLVKQVRVAGNAVSVQIELTAPNADVARQIQSEAEAVLKQSGFDSAQVEVKLPAAGGAAPNPWNQQAKVSGLKHVLAVASGKGGVGKSTVSVNLACALAQLGAAVGLLDCDIYGPSIPLMMGINDRPSVSADQKLEPPSQYGVKLMSIGFLVEADSPVIWRGPMIMKTIQQFIHSVDWGTLDFLLVDLPPGTGDAQLSLCQTVPLDGGVVVTTPQEASVGVVRKGIAMFEKLNVPIVGIVENMSYFRAPSGEQIPIFGHGGGRAEAERKGLTFLGEVPIFMEIREGGDQGRPVVVNAPASDAARPFLEIAQKLQGAVIAGEGR